MKKIIVLICLMPISMQANIFKGIFNLTTGNNFHVIQPNVAYRSGTMSSGALARAIIRRGIKSVINLRGAEPGKKWWQRQVVVLGKLGIKKHFYNIAMTAKALPSPANIKLLLSAFERAPRPVLIHCQAGADRTGEAAALWVITQQRKSKAEALKQLSDSFGHFSKRYPAKKQFIGMLPDNPHQVTRWLRTKYASTLAFASRKPVD